MRKLLLIPAVGLLAALSLGAAASLGGIQGGQVGASDADVTSCNKHGVKVSYGVEYSDLFGGFVIDTVTVSKINPACAGQTLHVVLTQDGQNIGEGMEASTAVTSETVQIDFPRAPAELVNDIHVAIYD